ncbi:MAG: arginase family protein [Nitrospinales bacterium]
MYWYRHCSLINWRKSLDKINLAAMPGGQSYRHVVDLLNGLTKKANVCGFNLVELMPDKDINGFSALIVARIIFNMIGALVRSPFFAQCRI